MKISTPDQLLNHLLANKGGGHSFEYCPLEGDQTAFLQVKGDTVCYCDVDKRAAVPVIQGAIAEAGYKLFDINERERKKAQRRAIAGDPPDPDYLPFATKEDAKQALVSYVSSTKKSSVTSLPQTKGLFSRAFALFGKNRKLLDQEAATTKLDSNLSSSSTRR